MYIMHFTHMVCIILVCNIIYDMCSIYNFDAQYIMMSCTSFCGVVDEFNIFDFLHYNSIVYACDSCVWGDVSFTYT